ncbi:hypothetical protein CYMTET_16434 [Cymbomonas tetramitiformis]|uniref:Nucleotide-diphospho-sugar transferase domain-containing protein n=1 Tax=Cymbomonas tetramitiformis TaxID=36881 RepID=A0AAE0GC12_9CHLO|nr:hypothetical protein CYMTET_16434 [Cymbomonas tetramitiformis]
MLRAPLPSIELEASPSTSPGLTTTAPGSVTPFPGGDLESPGVWEKALATRAPGKELILMAVGDTRDHRRAQKDPALKRISLEFVVNLVRNLHSFGIDHYLMLASSEDLCNRLRATYDIQGCAWSSHLHAHPGLPSWNLQPGDMFLLWAQQWHYVAKAIEHNVNVMRVDSDVVFTENPYPILKGPLFSRFNVLAQTDIFKERIECGQRMSVVPPEETERVKALVGDLNLCGKGGGPLINVGLVYIQNAKLGGAIHDVVTGTVAQIVSLLDSLAEGSEKGDPNRLIDQPIMREQINKHNKRGGWYMMNAEQSAGIYGMEAPCPHAPEVCDQVTKARRQTAFAVATLQKDGDSMEETWVGAPDWLFGRACVKHVTNVNKMLPRFNSSSSGTMCPSAAGNPAPGPLGAAMVGIHMVYSKAKKRKNLMEAMQWWNVEVPADEIPPGSTCQDPLAGQGLLFSHTFLRQVTPSEGRGFMCSMRPTSKGCACCVGIPETISNEDLEGLHIEDLLPLFGVEAI